LLGNYFPENVFLGIRIDKNRKEKRSKVFSLAFLFLANVFVKMVAF
jgi:hypothetical protein